MENFTPININNIPSFDFTDTSYNIAAQQIKSAINTNNDIFEKINSENTTPNRILKELSETNKITNEILNRHNAELANLAQQVEELQKSNDNLSILNKKYDKKLKEAKIELKKSKRLNVFMAIVAVISMIAAIVMPFITK